MWEVGVTGSVPRNPGNGEVPEERRWLFSLDGKEKKETGEESRLGSGRPVNMSLRATQGSGRSIYGGKV